MTAETPEKRRRAPVAASVKGTETICAADDLARLPSEAVVVAIARDERRRCGGRQAVASQAFRPRTDRACQIKRAAQRGGALARELLRFGMIAELIDDVRLPIGRSIARIGGVQRRFLVREVGVQLA